MAYNEYGDPLCPYCKHWDHAVISHDSENLKCLQCGAHFYPTTEAQDMAKKWEKRLTVIIEEKNRELVRLSTLLDEVKRENQNLQSQLDHHKEASAIAVDENRRMSAEAEECYQILQMVAKEWDNRGKFLYGYGAPACIFKVKEKLKTRQALAGEGER